MNFKFSGRCPICLGDLDYDNFEFLSDFTSDDGFFELFECKKCSGHFWTPFKNPGPEWYEKCAQNLRHRAVNDHDFFLWMAENRGITKHFIENPPHKEPKGKKLLDVGCGTGGFLIEAKKLGYEVFGVDFDQEQIKTAKSFGNQNVFNGDVFEFLNKHHEEFDVITGFEIIEHLDNPKEFLRLIFQALKPNGYICLSTPNRNRIGLKNEFWDFPYHHLSRWSKLSLSNLVKSVGYKKINIIEELPIDYLVSKSRIGAGVFIRKLMAKNKKINNQKETGKYRDTVARLGFRKDKLLRFLFRPLAYLLFISGKRGQGLYLIAQK